MNNIQNILVTGGTGYIGSHTCVELLDTGYNVIVVDNLCNSNIESLERIKKISGEELRFIEADLRDSTKIDQLFSSCEIDAVIHFAGLKAVGESVNIPVEYYQNNITGTLNLLEAMKAHDINNIVFSSSATVYGEPDSLPITEKFPLSATNPYGRSKLIVEDILRDISNANNDWNISILRYFNPVGAHESGLIGEDPKGIPNNLMPYIAQVAAGQLSELAVYGNDYSTVDGTGVRDYIHVVDLAKGHIKALEKLKTSPGCITHNLGTGQGYSVFEMVEAFKIASGKDVPYKVIGRREGDIAVCYADPSLAATELQWVAEKNIQNMCDDAWRWQKMTLSEFR